MKKRFTIMLDETTIWAIQKLRQKYSPIGLREELERVLWQYACEELEKNETK